MRTQLDIWDLVLGVLYLSIAYIIASRLKKKNEVAHPEYRYFTQGLFAKIFAGIGVCLVYTYYYDGGDTINYYLGSVAMVNLFLKDVQGYLTVLFGDELGVMIYQFDSQTGYPAYYMIRDPKTFSVIQFSSILMFFSFNSFICVVILLAVLCYTGIFRFYRMLVELFPGNDKHLAIAVLFVPSVVFWGSGLLKDAYTFSAVCWFVVGFYHVFILKRKILFNSAVLIVAAFFMIQIKPYIFIALIPGSLLWASFEYIGRIRSSFLKFLGAPIILLGSVALGTYVLTSMSGSYGKFSLEESLEHAAIVQQDLKAAYYGGNSFDIGEFEPTMQGVVVKAPLAINAGLFRPYIWEARNPFMLLSALENAFLLLATIFVIVKLGLRRIASVLNSNPYILFALLFSVFFAFSIGLATSNFGSLVRYKIPILPFYVSSLVILLKEVKLMRQAKL